MEATGTILSIDDSSTNQKLVQRILAPSYRVVPAESGSQGLELLNRVEPNLILLDVDMPGINGYQTCREIRAHRGFESIPILFFSCLTDPKDQLEGYAAGGDDYINKPVDIDVLRAKIAVNLQRSHHSARGRIRPTAVRFDEVLATFLQRCIFAYSTTLVAEELFKASESMGLETAVRLHDGHDRTFTNIDAISTLEDILLDKSEGFYPIQNGSRYALSSDHLVVLVRNIRLLGDDMQDHFQRALTTMINAANERITQIKSK